MYRRSDRNSLCLLLSLTLIYATVAKVTIQTSRQSNVRLEKQAYLSHVRDLYDLVSKKTVARTDDPNDFIRSLALKGIVGDLLSATDSPVRTLMPYRRVNEVLQEGSDGSFKSFLTVDPPFKGELCFFVEGEVDYETISGKLSQVSAVSCSERPGATWSTVSLSELKYGSDVESQGYTNGSDGIDELLNLSKKTQCQRNLEGECERGTVAMDEWVNQTLTFQRRLAEDIPLSQQQLLGSHNSFNDRAEGYGDIDGILNDVLRLVSDSKWEFVWAQQYFTMTDQLNMGVRYLMMDPVYFWGAMRLCHCGTTFKWVDKLVDYLEKILHIKFDFDSGDLGCLPDDRKFEDGVKEISDWMRAPGHEREVVMININDFAKDHDWGHISLIHDPIRQLFGDMIFSPDDKDKYFPDGWPTTTQLLARGKRVIVIGPDRITNETLVFHDMTVPAWDKDTTMHFTPYPQCGGYSPGQWYTIGGESQVVGPIYNGPKEEGLITTENMPYLLQCPVTVLKIDLVSPGLLESAVWSWARGYSVANVTSSQCTAMNISDSGRWVTLPCSTQLRHACNSTSQKVLSNTTGSWKDGPTSCPDGYTFYVPLTGYDNWQFYQFVMMLNSSRETYVWLNFQHF